MTQKNIQPDKITKPIQLLAAWLVGLIAVNASFLTAAGIVTTPTWGSALLLIAAVANVPLFIIALFLLQTKFRPQMQADDYYQTYLERQDEMRKIEISELQRDKEEQTQKYLEGIIEAAKIQNEEEREKAVKQKVEEQNIELIANAAATNVTLSILCQNDENKWKRYLSAFQGRSWFTDDMNFLIVNKLIKEPVVVGVDVKMLSLTILGEKVVDNLNAQKKWNTGVAIPNTILENYPPPQYYL